MNALNARDVTPAALDLPYDDDLDFGGALGRMAEDVDAETLRRYRSMAAFLHLPRREALEPPSRFGMLERVSRAALFLFLTVSLSGSLLIWG